MSATDLHAVRFSSMRNGKNCFLQRMIEANSARNIGQIHEFTVRFTQGEYQISPTTLSVWHVDESFGVLTDEALPSLDDLVAGAANILKPSHVEYTPKELLALDVQMDRGFPEVDHRTVETSTFVFNPGWYQDVRIV